MLLIELLPGRQKTSDPLSHTSLWLNLSGQCAQIQMSVTVHQGGEQGGLIMVAGRSLRPLAAEERKGSHVQNRAFGHHHCPIFNGRPGYGDDQAGPVENRAGFTPPGSPGDGGPGRI